MNESQKPSGLPDENCEKRRPPVNTAGKETRSEAGPRAKVAKTKAATRTPKTLTWWTSAVAEERAKKGSLGARAKAKAKAKGAEEITFVLAVARCRGFLKDISRVLQ